MTQSIHSLVDTMTTHYIVTALWSSNDESRDDGGDFLDQNYDESDIAPGTLKAMRDDCEKFFKDNMAAILCEGAPLAGDIEGSTDKRKAAMAGHDFWLTRCGHGAGFWDGDWPEPHATQLDKASEKFGNVDLYLGNNGLIDAM